MPAHVSKVIIANKRIHIRVLNDSSMGLRSGEYDGRNKSKQPKHPTFLVSYLEKRMAALTCTIDQFQQCLIVMNVAIIKDQHALLLRIWIHLRELQAIRIV